MKVDRQISLFPRCYWLNIYKCIYLNIEKKGEKKHLRSLLWAVLQHCVEDLHVVGISGIGQLIEDHQLHHSSQVVSVCIEQLPRDLQPKQQSV